MSDGNVACRSQQHFQARKQKVKNIFVRQSERRFLFAIFSSVATNQKVFTSKKERLHKIEEEQ